MMEKPVGFFQICMNGADSSQKWLRDSLDVSGRFPSRGAPGLAECWQDFDSVAQQTQSFMPALT